MGSPTQGLFPCHEEHHIWHYRGGGGGGGGVYARGTAGFLTFWCGIAGLMQKSCGIVGLDNYKTIDGMWLNEAA